MPSVIRAATESAKLLFLDKRVFSNFFRLSLEIHYKNITTNRE